MVAPSLGSLALKITMDTPPSSPIVESSPSAPVSAGPGIERSTTAIDESFSPPMSVAGGNYSPKKSDFVKHDQSKILHVHKAQTLKELADSDTSDKCTDKREFSAEEEEDVSSTVICNGEAYKSKPSAAAKDSLSTTTNGDLSRVRCDESAYARDPTAVEGRDIATSTDSSEQSSRQEDITAETYMTSEEEKDGSKDCKKIIAGKSQQQTIGTAAMVSRSIPPHLRPALNGAALGHRVSYHNTRRVAMILTIIEWLASSTASRAKECTSGFLR